MNDTTKFIHKTVYRVATESNGKEQWMKYRHDIRRRLEQLEPDKPDDGTSGFLAYNVGCDKPRMKIKIGRFFTKKLQLNSGYLPDVEIQKISTTVSMKLWPNIRTKLVRGSDITAAYKNCIGASSCMTGSCADYTLMYESNPSRFQMLIMQHRNNSARAIVHKLDNDKYLMDRVYSDSESLKEKMRGYAIEQGWYYRYSDKLQIRRIHYSGCELNDYNEIIVSGLVYRNGEVPYMDTLTEYRLRGSEMNIFHPSSSYTCDGTLDSTCGELGDQCYCEDCEGTISENDVVIVDERVLCRGCLNSNYSYCESCESYYHNDDAVHIVDSDEYVCQCCADNRYYRCLNCDDYYSEDASHCVHDGWVCESCFDNYIRCADCGEYFTSDDMGENSEYCRNCQPDDEDIPEQNPEHTMEIPHVEWI